MNTMHKTLACGALAACFTFAAGSAQAEESCTMLRWLTSTFESNHAPTASIDELKARMAAVDCAYS